MFLYELAIELDRKSGELVDAAAALGMGQLTASSTLDPTQVHQLRQRIGAPAMGAPAGALPGPATFAPPPPGPPADGPVPFAAPSSAPPSAPPAFVPPVAFAPPAPGQPAFPPPPPPPPSGPAIGVPASGPPPAPAPASQPRPARPGGFSRGQLVALGVAGVLVLGLFGFMVINSGPDEARERAIAEDETAVEPTEVEVATSLATATTEVPPTTAEAQDLTVPIDEAAFCDGGRSLVAIQLRVSAAIIDEDLGLLQGIARDERAAWDGALDQVSVGGPPSLVDEVERYQSGIGRWFDALAGGADLEGARQAAGGIEFLRALNAGDEFLRQVGFYCQ